MSHLNLIFAGSGEFGLPSLRALMNEHRIVQVFSQPDRPAGRGRKFQPTPIARFSIDHALPLVRTGDINKESIPPADLMVVIAFGQKIAPHVVNAPRMGSVNLHASILPKYRGAAPINWAILKGETHTGNSVIRLAERMDAGAILGQSCMEIGGAETAGELHDRLADDGPPLLQRVIADLAAQKAVERSQDEAQATIAPKLSREGARIDWTQPAATIALKIRGLSPWPGCHVRLLDPAGNELCRITLLRATASEASVSGALGKILADGRIAATDGAVDILELQPEGRRSMKMQEFQNGHLWPPGGILESIT